MSEQAEPGLEGGIGVGLADAFEEAGEREDIRL